jgi:uncharacterized protein
MASAYFVPVAQLLRDVPATSTVSFHAPFDEKKEFPRKGEAETDVDPNAEVAVDLELQSFVGGLRAKGTIAVDWLGTCRRCSNPVTGRVQVSVREQFVDERTPEDQESYLIDHDFIDLAPLVHDAVFLELPLAPLCSEDCQGLCAYCGINKNEGSCTCQGPIDPRWATLDGLRFLDQSSEND